MVEGKTRCSRRRQTSLKFGHMVLEICKWRDRQIYRQTDMLMAIRALILLKPWRCISHLLTYLLFTPTGGEVLINCWWWWNDDEKLWPQAATITRILKYDVTDARGESHLGQLCLSRQPLRYTALDTGCATLLQCLCRLQLSAVRAKAKWASPSRLSSINNKLRWWMWTVAIYRQTQSPLTCQNGITQCYLPPGIVENPAFTPSRSKYSI